MYFLYLLSIDFCNSYNKTLRLYVILLELNAVRKMKKIAVFIHIFMILSLLLSVSPMAMAQTKAQEGTYALYIKLGNLLRRGSQDELGEYFIRKGLSVVKDRDRYWEAAAYEGLGLIYRSRGDEETANKYFLDALGLYGMEKITVCEKAMHALIDSSASNKEVFKNFNDYKPSNVREAFINIRVANALIEAKQYEVAQKLLLESLSMVKDANMYWEASAYEYLGMLGWETDNNVKAGQYFNLAIPKYAKLNCNITVAVLKHLLKSVEQKEEIYGGIEIGSKGIRASVIGVKLTKSGEYVFDIKHSEADHSVSLAPTKAGDPIADLSMTSAANIIKFYADKLVSEHEVPQDRIFVVGSSGVALAKNTEDLKKKIQATFRTFPPNIEFVTPEQEVQFDIIGTIPTSTRYQAAVIDIGAGNIKVGCMTKPSNSNKDEPNVFAFSIPYGTENFKELVKQQKGDFNATAKQLANTKILPTLRTELQRKGIIKERKIIYLMGIASWELATYLYPQYVNEHFVPIIIADINRFRDMSTLTYDKLVNPNLSKITDEQLRQNAEAEINKAKNQVSDKQSTISGSLLLATVANEYNQPKADKEFFFARNGVTGWVAGYAVHYIAESYKRLKEADE